MISKPPSLFLEVLMTLQCAHRLHTNRHRSWMLLLFFAMLAAAPAAAQTALRFDGGDDRVTFGQAAELGLTTFTIETWFRREGPGVTTNTGPDGVIAIPLMAKGRVEAEGSTVDMNWFLGIRGTDSVLVADFEDNATGANHPVIGARPVRSGVWYHAAATYDGTTWRLYLNGQLEAQLAAGFTPQSGSIQHAGLATSMNSFGAVDGFFLGSLDETRVWNVACTQTQIRDNLLLEQPSGSGLVARWGMNEGSGASLGNSVGGGVNGTLVGGPTWVAGSPFVTEYALDLGGTDAYVNLGSPAALQLAALTIEMWIRRDGPGRGTDTGLGGIRDAIPLVAKGRAEADDGLRDVNYLFGIRESDGVLCADFEEAAGGDGELGQNHPVAGVTPISNGTWHHVAVTYDGTWKLYLNGFLDASLTVNQPMGSASTVAVALGSALNSLGVPQGYFNGAMDEVRVWNVARTQTEIQSAANARLIVAQPNLVARWALDEGAGLAISGSAGSTIHGTVAGANWTWTAPAPFDLSFDLPAAPTGLTATAEDFPGITLQWTDNATNESRFDIERSTTGAGGPFVPLATLYANSTGYADGVLAASTEYCYRIRAANGAGVTSYTAAECATTSALTAIGLEFDGANALVNFGAPASLKLTQLTIEMWIRRDGPGQSTSTGTGGISGAIPLLAKGRADGEESARDINYLFGLRASTGTLCADFEEGVGGTGPVSLNHPILGTTPITIGNWHHVAVTYDGTWRLYLDGVLDGSLVVNQPMDSASTLAVSLGSALNQAGTAAGFFDGAMDEVRIWNVARSQAQLQSTANAQLTTPQPNLVSRWSLNEGAGTGVGGSAGTIVNGVLAGTAWSWTGGAPFDLAFNLPPDVPTMMMPADHATGVSTHPALTAMVSDPDLEDLVVSFYGRPSLGAEPDFTLIPVPDTQYYTSQLNGGTVAMLDAQFEWIVNQREARNIQQVVHLGDCVENGDNGGNDIEWQRVDAAFDRLENPVATGLPEGVPFGICVGNHDKSPIDDPDGTAIYFNQYFGSARFNGRSYYGGHYGANNNNWYQLFSASGLDFILVGIEYDPTPDDAVLAWADLLLQTHANRRAIVASHWLAGTGNPAAFSTQGQAIYEALKDRPNLFLMLASHVSGEGRRQDVFEGRTVHTLVSNYQTQINGGNGWLRIMEFSPANNVIRVRTYSPTLDQFEADADSSSQFTIPYTMASNAPYELIGTVNGVASGTGASRTWPGLTPFSEYEWYTTASDGPVTVSGPVWHFTTGEVAGVESGAVAEIELGPVVPNPTHREARITFVLPRPADVHIEVMDVQGRRVGEVFRGRLAAGRYERAWNASVAGVEAGLYFIRAKFDGREMTRRVAIVP
jgi:Concanavalin A-like lectin/glucanases superfamily/Calcineurin-like phosphoesterase